jgi:hypothetical protein
MKFFAFPKGPRNSDPNAVIGGFQGKDWKNPYGWASSEANLKAVTISVANNAPNRSLRRIGRKQHLPQGELPITTYRMKPILSLSGALGVSYVSSPIRV